METSIGADAAKLAGLQIDMLQKMRNGQITPEHLEWFNGLKKGERDQLSGACIIDDRFELLNTFDLAVPKDYDHVTQLATFRKENRDKFYFYNDAITDQNFAKATNKLIPGKIYAVKIFGIRAVVSSSDCLAFLRTQATILVGAQGISVAWQQVKDRFPIGKWLVSFDEKAALPWESAGGYHRVPIVRRDSDGDWVFSLGGFGDDWVGGYCLLCFCDVG